MSDFSIEWSRDFEDQLKRLAADAVREIASDFQEMLDRVSSEYSGQPVDTIKSILQQAWEELGGTIGDPDLTDYATVISEGGRIQVNGQE